MALFGKKKLSLDEILRGISELSEEERAKVLSSMQGGDSAPTPDEGEQETEETKEPVEETEEAAAESENTELEEPSEGETETPEQETESKAETEVEAGAEMEETLEGTEPMAETPAEAPQVEESAQGSNYDELIKAQNAKIDSLESQLAEFKEKLETVVANQDNQNFGYSPKSNFENDAQTSRRDAILQGYAPRRVDQYK